MKIDLADEFLMFSICGLIFAIVLGLAAFTDLIKG